MPEEAKRMPEELERLPEIIKILVDPLRICLTRFLCNRLITPQEMIELFCKILDNLIMMYSEEHSHKFVDLKDLRKNIGDILFIEHLVQLANPSEENIRSIEFLKNLGEAIRIVSERNNPTNL